MNEMQQISEWVTKQELINACDIKPSEADKSIKKLIMDGFVEADYSDMNNPRYKIAEYSDGSHYKKIKHFLESVTIRHGYNHIKNKYALEGKKCNIKNSKIFEIAPKLVWILQKTNNEIFKRELPFDDFVLDCDLKTKNFWFKGILIKKVLIKGKETNNIFTFYGKDEFCNKYMLTTLFDENDEPLTKTKESDKWEKVKINKTDLKELKVFVCNFLDFLNQPEVRIIRFERSEKNKQRRLNQGKDILPSILKIRLDGKLKAYYNSIVNFENLKHKYIVRGHYMRFWDKKRYSSIYKLLELNNLPEKYHIDKKMRGYQDIIAIWKKPFIKGSGMLISKKYQLKKTKLRRKKNG